eukprot:7235699-Lingulodinium_polyedra.AAC.2
MGPGEFEIQAPPGSHCLQLYKAESGHLMLPVTEYQSETKRDRVNQGIPKAAPEEFVFPYVPPTTSMASGSGGGAPASSL